MSAWGVDEGVGFPDLLDELTPLFAWDARKGVAGQFDDFNGIVMFRRKVWYAGIRMQIEGRNLLVCNIPPDPDRLHLPSVSQRSGGEG